MAARRRAVEYRSEQAWGTLPLVHVAVGGRQAGGRYRLGRARGVIALGDVATGLVAVGGVAIGLFSVGGVAVGPVALGAVALGLVAVGAVAVGLFAAGAVAVGLTAVGAVTAGLLVGPRPPGGIAPSGSCRPRTGARVAASRLMEAPRGR
jgi:hypothetical protein